MKSEFLEYLELELNRSALTVKAYGNDLRDLAEFLGKDEELTDAAGISTSDIRAWLADMARNGLSPRTLRRKNQAARAFFRWIQKRSIIDRNPAKEIQLAKAGRKLPQVVRVEEAERILTDIHGTTEQQRQRNHLIINLLYSCGIRCDELSKITDADISMPARELRIHGKRDKTRIIPLPDALAKEIKEWQQTRDTLYHHPSPAPLICTPNGSMSHSSIYKIVRSHLLTTGSTHKGPHTLRHTFATAMLNDGAEINTVKEFLGHSSLQSTQIYTHLTFSDIKKAYDRAHPRGEETEKN